MQFEGAAKAQADTLFGRILTSLDDFTKDPSVKLNWDSDKGIHVVGPELYTTKPGKIQMLPGGVSTLMPALDVRAARKIETEFNKMYQGLKSVYDNRPVKKEGDTLESFIIEMMIERGLTPTKVEGLPKELMDNIMAAHSKPKMPPGAE
jgi:hypothetical protein